jgi:hypothetical protein
MQPWYSAKRAQRVEVAQIRRRFIGDTALPRIRQHLDGIDINPAERAQVDAFSAASTEIVIAPTSSLISVDKRC